MYDFQIFFSYSIGCPFSFLMVVFDTQRCLILLMSSVSRISFPIALSWHVYQKSIVHKHNIYFLNINPIPFNYISILIPASHSLDYSTLLIKFWNWDVCVYQVCSYFLDTWLFWVPNTAIWILESFCQHLRRI